MGNILFCDWSNFSMASASNRNIPINIHEWGKNLLLCNVRGRREGREGLCILPETLFLAPSLPLSVYSWIPVDGEAKYSCTEADAWCRNKNRNKFMVRACRTTARGAASLGRTEQDRWRKLERWRGEGEAPSYMCNWMMCVLTDQNCIHYMCVRWHVTLL